MECEWVEGERISWSKKSVLHECTDVLALAMLRIYCCFCIVVLIIRFESHDSAFDILHSKRLLLRGGEFHAHSMMPEHHCWESLR